METFKFNNDAGQPVTFTGNRYQMLRVVDFLKETAFSWGNVGTIGIGLIDLKISTKGGRVAVSVKD